MVDGQGSSAAGPLRQDQALTERQVSADRVPREHHLI